MAAPDNGTGDADSQQMLNDAYTQARQSLKGSVPDGLLNSLTTNQAPPQGAVGVGAGGSTGVTDQAPPGSEFVDQPPEGASNPFDKDTPPPEAKPVSDQTHGNGDMWSLSNMRDFFRDEFKGTQEEAGKGLMRGLAKLGSGAATIGAGATAAIADKAADLITGGYHTQAEDKVFDFKRDYIDPAIQYWTPQRQAVTGQGEGS